MEAVVPRTYLYVPPEEKAEVQGLGARWDTDAKCWYIESDEAPGQFSRWLLDTSETDAEAADAADGYTVISSEACVVAAIVPCQHCGADTEVICLHCLTGTVGGEPLEQFTVSDIQDMDLLTADQLSPWPQFHWAGSDGPFANHCTHCGKPQDDMLLHSEPEEPFFDVPVAIITEAVAMTPLLAGIRVSGDEHFRID